eukprot:1160781-Pelagomonas_calceolata.AAC.9
MPLPKEPPLGRCSSLAGVDHWASVLIRLRRQSSQKHPSWQERSPHAPALVWLPACPSFTYI